MKVEKKDNWGTLEYYWGGIKIDASVNGKIRLPDGTECDYESRPHYESVSDWGQTHSVKSNKLIAIVPFNGQMIEVELDKLDISWITPNAKP